MANAPVNVATTALGGAATGAAIGTAIPVVGTVIGAIVGAGISVVGALFTPHTVTSVQGEYNELQKAFHCGRINAAYQGMTLAQAQVKMNQYNHSVDVWIVNGTTGNPTYDQVILMFDNANPTFLTARQAYCKVIEAKGFDVTDPLETGFQADGITPVPDSAVRQMVIVNPPAALSATIGSLFGISSSAVPAQLTAIPDPGSNGSGSLLETITSDLSLTSPPPAAVTPGTPATGLAAIIPSGGVSFPLILIGGGVALFLLFKIFK